MQTQTSVLQTRMPAALHASCVGAGRQSQGRLWSSLNAVCELLRIDAPASFSSEKLLFQHVQFEPGQLIHTVGQCFDTLYLVHSGFLKTGLIDEFGNEQVLSFPMKGDLLGLNGIHGHYHASEAVALTDCELVLLPFKRLAALGRVHPEFDELMYCAMSRELAHEQVMIGQLGACAAEVRVARFLLSQAERFAAIGGSGRQFTLSMSRLEIGSYLGLSLETVSRTLSALKDVGLITVAQRAIGIQDAAGLLAMRRLPSLHSRKKDGVDDSVDGVEKRRAQ
ncbi:MAG: helix-turn-helix domain-containing protein [Pseudomonadota bacterium]